MNMAIKSIGKAALCGIFAAAFSTTLTQAQPYTLTDGSSFAIYDPTSVGGMTNWTVGGANQLASQSFWVRTGSDTRELSLDEIYQSSGGSGNYAQASFGVDGLYSIGISYTLTELAADSAQIVESISIQNISGSPLTLSFFQYNNFDLADDMSGDYVRILTDGNSSYSVAQQVQPGVGGISEEATVQNNPGSVYAQVAYYSTILDMLEDTDIDTLSNSTGIMGPGNMEFAFQWDYNLAAGQTELISKVKTLDVTIIPEPATASLVLLGLGAVMARRLSRRGEHV